MNEAWAALLGALIGGLLSLGGALGVAWYQANREQDRLERDRLRENLYALQDAIDPVFRNYFAALEAKWVTFQVHSIPSPELASAVFRLNMLSVRVGDDVLGSRLTAILEALARARKAESRDEAFQSYNEAQSHITPVQHRIGELLHTNANIDLGT